MKRHGFTDTYVMHYVQTDRRACYVCFAPTDPERGWVKSQETPDGSPTYWLCDECLDAEPSLVWEGHKLREVQFG